VRAANAQADADAKSLRLSLDTKATVLLGEYSRRGKARGQKPLAAQDHDMAPDKEKLIPVGILEVGVGQLDLCFATSPAKTSDLLADCLENWWRRRGPTYQGVEELVLNVDNGPESNGRRTQFLSRLADFADKSGLRLHLVYYPPYHSKYNPVERCWAVLEKHWNGALLKDAQTALGWAKTMTWKGILPLVKLTRKVYRKGQRLVGAAKRKLEARLQRHPDLPWWDIRINPRPV
jgi:hypothetical protein